MNSDPSSNPRVPNSDARWHVLADDADSAELSLILDDYLSSLERGEPIDRDELIAAHPHLRQPLQDCLANLDALNAAAIGLKKIEAAPLLPLLSEAGTSRRVGEFLLVREIGRGGMGVVYEAEQLTLKRRVALKVLPLSGLLDQRRIARFKNESTAAASLEHPHIVSVFAIGCDAGIHYFAMQLIDGSSLAEVIDERWRSAAKTARPATDPSADTVKTTVKNAARSTIVTSHGPAFYQAVANVGLQAAAALQYAHEHGIVHRDIKPSNLLLDQSSHLWVTDFGLAGTQADVGLTRTGELLGTLRYMSPEQASGNLPVDHRTDVYSLGATLYELASGKPVIASEHPAEALREAIDQSAKPVRSLDRAIPIDLATIIDKALCREPGDRYNTAAEMASDLQRFLDSRPVLARRPSALRKATSWLRRHVVVSALTAAVASSLLLAAVMGFSQAWRLAKQHDSLQNSLYARDIALAHRLVEQGDIVRAESILVPWLESDPHHDRRGWEWFYLWNRCQDNAGDAILFHPGSGFDAELVASSGIIYSASFSNKLRAWDRTTYEPIDNRTITTPHQQIITIELDPTQQVLASGGSEGIVCLWNLRDGTQIDQFAVTDPPHGRRIIDFAFSSNGRYLVASTHDHFDSAETREMVALVWDRAQRRLVQTIRGLGQFPHVNFSPQNELYITCASGDVAVWSATNEGSNTEPIFVQTRSRSLLGLPIWSSRLTADGRWLVTSSCEAYNPEARSRFDVWDTNDWSLQQTYFAEAPDRWHEMDTGDNRWLLVGGQRGHVSLYDLEEERHVRTRQVHRGRTFRVRFASDGKTLLSTSIDNSVRIWDRERFVATDTATHATLRSTSVLNGALFAGDADHVCVVHKDGTVWDWNVAKGTVDHSFRVELATANASTFDVSRDGQLLAITRCVELRDVKDARVELHDRRRFHAGESLIWARDVQDGIFVARPKFSPDKRLLAFASNNFVNVVNAADGTLVRRIDSRYTKTMAFSPDGRWLAFTHGNRTFVHATFNWDQRMEISTAEWLTEALDFRPDSQAFATSDAEFCVNLWDLPSGRRIARSPVLSDLITALFFSPDGERIGAISKDGSLYMLDAHTLEPLLTLPIPSEWTFAGGFSPDGQRFVVGIEHTTQVFNAGPIDDLKRLNFKELKEIVCGPLLYIETAASGTAAPNAAKSTEASDGTLIEEQR